MFEFNRESRKVKFLTRTSTSQQQPQQPQQGADASKDNDNNDNNNDNVGFSAPTQTEGENPEKGQNENESAAAPNGGGDIGSIDEIRQLSPNFVLSATPLHVRETAPPPPPPPAGAAGPERKSESVEQADAGKSSEPIPPPPPRNTSPSPPPIPSSSTHTLPKRAASPTPSGSTSKQTAAPRPSRSVRMRTPKRLPDPPHVPPAYVGMGMGMGYARPSSPEARTSISLPRTSSVGSSRTFDSGMRSTSPTPLLPPVPPVPPVPVIPPVERASSPLSQLSLTRSPLRNSVLPSDNPVILPRPKHAPRTSESQPVSPTSTLGRLPSLSASTSQSGGEPPKPAYNRFLGSLRRGGKGKSPAGVDQRPISEASVYSTND